MAGTSEEGKDVERVIGGSREMRIHLVYPHQTASDHPLTGVNSQHGILVQLKVLQGQRRGQPQGVAILPHELDCERKRGVIPNPILTLREGPVLTPSLLLFSTEDAPKGSQCD